MSKSNTVRLSYIVNNISLPYDASFIEAFSVAGKKLRSLDINTHGADFSIYRRSVDARKKNDIRFVYSVRVTGDFPHLSSDKLSKHGVSLDICQAPTFSIGTEPIHAPPVIVGSGPCGLFCALLLAENGYKPILLERGGSITDRKSSIASFESTRRLDPDCNIQFGAGGAGTFSDGKLITRINDPLSAYILTRLVEFGAPREIMYVAKPHVGTDVLSTVVDKAIERIVDLGGTVMFRTAMTGYNSKGGVIRSVETTRGDIECSMLVLAIGHSARDTYSYLINEGISIEGKSFSVGMRIEHPADLIDKSMYGDFAGDPILGHAEYNLAYNTKIRGVYTFCMCPGGVVVAATSENGGVVSNGMSYHARNGNNSNSAVCCSVFKEDYGNTPWQAIDFQRKIEHAAYLAGGSDYSAPIITVGDFLSGELRNLPSDVHPTYMNGAGVKLARPEAYLPGFVCDNIKNGILDFENKIHGFSSATAVLTGAETRTSAPVRILRDNDTRLAPGFYNLYPAGEGAGYAGGITSAAIDGVKTAVAIMNKYKP